jgi:hypothetical protein
VTQTFWKTKVDGVKCPERIDLCVSDEGIKFCFTIDSKERQIDLVRDTESHLFRSRSSTAILGFRSGSRLDLACL